MKQIARAGWLVWLLIVVQQVSTVAGARPNVIVILDTVKRAGIAENTFIFFSDNGAIGAGGSNKPFRGGKFSHYEGGASCACNRQVAWQDCPRHHH
jgi:hypothetical protein